MVHPHLYLVVHVLDPSSFRDPKPEPGQLMFWIWRGYYYTMQVINVETGKVKPVLNIVWLKKLTEEERRCLDENKTIPTCLDKGEIMLLAAERLEKAKKRFGLTDQEIEAIMKRLKRAFERSAGD